MRTGEFVRQGDVVFRRIEAGTRPEGRVRESGIVAYGEVTGHAHRVVGGATVFEAAADRIFVEVTGTAEVVHEEHKPITLTRGVYEVIGQREWTAGDERRVSD